jgi:hypothetical protein
MNEEKFTPVYEITLDTIKDIINVFQPDHPYWASFYPNAWIFRGHALENWKLLPSVYRDNIREEFGLISPYGIDLMNTTQAEYQLIREFSILCDSVGLQLPEIAFLYILNNQRQHEGLKEEEILRRFPDTEIHHLIALAQHNRIPTRLLDFTYDPLTALFFAAEYPNIDLTGNQYFIVYAINRLTFNFNGRYKEIFAPSFSNDNLRSQKGLFLLDSKIHEALERHELPPDMETILKKAFEEKLQRDKGMMTGLENNYYFYRKIKIPESLRMNVLKHLHKRHYNRAHLFPSYENIAETVRILTFLEPPSGWRNQPKDIKPQTI